MGDLLADAVLIFRFPWRRIPFHHNGFRCDF
jgi:hypothetical protein